MTQIESLMQRRIIIEHPYPGMKFKVQDILYRFYESSDNFPLADFYSFMPVDYKSIEKNYGLRVSRVRHYIPACEVNNCIKHGGNIFRELAWWESRESGDMPMYLKRIVIGVNIPKVCKVDRYLKSEIAPNRSFLFMNAQQSAETHLVEWYHPATEAEYLEATELVNAAQ